MKKKKSKKKFFKPERLYYICLGIEQNLEKAVIY
jgi:hypothetical protein